MGGVGGVVLRDRKHLSQDGLIVVVVSLNEDDGTVAAGPDIVTRGFIYAKEAEALVCEMKTAVLKTISRCASSGISDWVTLKAEIKSDLSSLLYGRTHRSPMILPVLMEV